MQNFTTDFKDVTDKALQGIIVEDVAFSLNVGTDIAEQLINHYRNVDQENHNVGAIINDTVEYLKAKRDKCWPDIEKHVKQITQKLMTEFQLTEEVATEFIDDFNSDLKDSVEHTVESYWLYMDSKDIETEILAYAKDSLHKE